MLNYIKKVVKPDRNEESYLIEYLGAEYPYEAGEELDSMLNHIKENIEKEIISNETQISRLEIEGQSSREKRILNTPALISYRRANKKLTKEIGLIKNFGLYLEALKSGKQVENSIFSEVNYDNPVTWTRRVGIHLGSKPRTVRELSVYRGILDKKIEKAKLVKGKYDERILYAYQLDAIVDPGKYLPVTDEIVSKVFEINKKDLEEEIVDLKEMVESTDSVLATAWEFVNDKLDFITPIATSVKSDSEILGKVADEEKLYQLRKAVINLDKDYNRVFRESYIAHQSLERAEKELEAFVKNNFRTRRSIISELIDYNNDILQSKYRARVVEELKSKGTSYVRKYRAK